MYRIEDVKKDLISAMTNENMFESFSEEYRENKTLDKFISYVTNEILNAPNTKYSVSVKNNYKIMIKKYNDGDPEFLLQALYEKILMWHDKKESSTSKLKSLILNDDCYL